MSSATATGIFIIFAAHGVVLSFVATHTKINSGILFLATVLSMMTTSYLFHLL